VLAKSGQTGLVSLAEAQAFTKTVVDEVDRLNLPYFTLLLHDRYYCASFKVWRDWYHWIIEYLIQADVTFISYEDALKELAGKSASVIELG
jgi:hypothetical protein